MIIYRVKFAREATSAIVSESIITTPIIIIIIIVVVVKGTALTLDAFRPDGTAECKWPAVMVDRLTVSRSNGLCNATAE